MKITIEGILRGWCPYGCVSSNLILGTKAPHCGAFLVNIFFNPQFGLKSENNDRRYLEGVVPVWVCEFESHPRHESPAARGFF